MLQTRIREHTTACDAVVTLSSRVKCMECMHSRDSKGSKHTTTVGHSSPPTGVLQEEQQPAACDAESPLEACDAADAINGSRGKLEKTLCCVGHTSCGLAAVFGC